MAETFFECAESVDCDIRDGPGGRNGHQDMKFQSIIKWGVVYPFIFSILFDANMSIEREEEGQLYIDCVLGLLAKYLCPSF